MVWNYDTIGTPMSHPGTLRNVARILVADALLQAREGESERAIQSCRAAFPAGRSAGDEPALACSMTRAYVDLKSMRYLERILATGSVSARALEEMQQQRAIQAEAALSRWSSAAVEIAKLPTEAQEEKLQQLTAPVQPFPVIIRALNPERKSGSAGVVPALNRLNADLRSAAAALAAERFRLHQKRWPEDLPELVSQYLAAVPIDPFDGQALRFRKLPDGIVIYSIGRDRTDNAATSTALEASTRDSITAFGSGTNRGHARRRRFLRRERGRSTATPKH